MIVILPCVDECSLTLLDPAGMNLNLVFSSPSSDENDSSSPSEDNDSSPPFITSSEPCLEQTIPIEDADINPSTAGDDTTSFLKHQHKPLQMNIRARIDLLHPSLKPQFIQKRTTEHFLMIFQIYCECLDPTIL